MAIKMTIRNIKWTLAASAAAMAVAGCGGGDSSSSSAPQTSRGNVASTANTPVPGGATGPGTPAPGVAAPVVDIKADAGIPVAGTMEPIQYMAGIRDKMVVTTRSDAFALLPTEKLFDRQQTAARLLSEMGGGFAMIYQEPPPKPDPEETIEKQPYRRLTGYLQGEGVMAIIEMEDGKTYLVRPGMQVGSTEWTCVSLDRDRAILRRPGAKLPHDIVVRLESKPVGGGGGGGGTGGGGGNAGGPPESGAGMAGERN